MTSAQRKKKIDTIREQVEAGLHPMQSPDRKTRKKAAEPIADKMIQIAIGETQKNH